MKKIISYILISVAMLCILGTIMWIVMCIHDYHVLVDDPSASGIDFLVVFFYPLGLAICSAVGFASSLIARLLYKSKTISVLSLIGIILFATVILLGMAYFIFFWIL